jgi:hypothetical protein
MDVDDLVRLALDHHRLVQGKDGQAYAVPHCGPPIAYRIAPSRREGLSPRLTALALDRYGRAARPGALKAALAVLTYLADDGAPEPVGHRVARVGDRRLVLDLGRSDGACVVVGPAVWQVDAVAPVPFRRTVLTDELPLPERGGTLDELRLLVNVESSEAWRSLLGWLVAALLADIAHPVLRLAAPSGGGKSWAGRLLVGLVDPSPVPLRTAPRNTRAWVTSAGASWVVGLDAVDGRSAWLADVLAHAVDGSGMVRAPAGRADVGDVSVLTMRRAVLLTSTEGGPLVERLGDRLVTVQLAPMTPARRSGEAALWSTYQHALPRLLGALLDLAGSVLALLPIVEARDVAGPCLDFARILAAIDALGVATS